MLSHEGQGLEAALSGLTEDLLSLLCPSWKIPPCCGTGRADLTGPRAGGREPSTTDRLLQKWPLEDKKNWVAKGLLSVLREAVSMCVCVHACVPNMGAGDPHLEGVRET